MSFAEICAQQAKCQTPIISFKRKLRNVSQKKKKKKKKKNNNNNNNSNTSKISKSVTFTFGQQQQVNDVLICISSEAFQLDVN